MPLGEDRTLAHRGNVVFTRNSAMETLKLTKPNIYSLFKEKK